MGVLGNFTQDQLQSFDFQGYLVIESFAMMKRMDQLLDDFDASSTASIFSTKNQRHLTDSYFYESAKKVSYCLRVLNHLSFCGFIVPGFLLGIDKCIVSLFSFTLLVEKAFGDDGNLKQPKQLPCTYLSFENQSSKSRHAYSLHVVDTDGCKWAPENWIRRKVEPEPLYVS
ncbi:hypothetical protein L6164_001575 [Bauhinia variegata]|uniref:Uncharacterized protein n=1 Tax=Bauhinia variegata TaxID=167791 RepID=A0ACB9Q9Y3_BAUVA|nr:hypothetical protein L6164_001575 [Bauhinia variegata]